MLPDGYSAVFYHGTRMICKQIYHISLIRHPATIVFAFFVWLLFEGGVYYFSGKPIGINDGWLRYICTGRVIQCGLRPRSHFAVDSLRFGS